MIAVKILRSNCKTKFDACMKIYVSVYKRYVSMKEALCCFEKKGMGL